MSAPDRCACSPDCTCGACRGIRDATPLAVANRPGLSSIRYRVGDHARFKESLLAGISRGRMPALRTLTTRRDDDVSVALLDAFAVVADILTFYQERIANESYLRTARERLSVGYLAKLIGYELRPGSAARVSLAFHVMEGPGAVETLMLAAGTLVQSTPGPDEKPQSFETSEEAEVRPAWNAIPVKTVRRQELSAVMPEVVLKGAALALRPGDSLLLVVPANATGTQFTAAFRRIASVEVDARADWTRVRLQPQVAAQATFDGLTAPPIGVFTFRKQASLFGFNAPNVDLLKAGLVAFPSGSDWNPDDAGNAANRLVLDTVYREVVPGSWGIWESPTVAGSPLIFKVATIVEKGTAAFGLSAKTTVLTLVAGQGITPAVKPTSFSHLRSASVLLQPEQLELREIPVPLPVPIEWPAGQLPAVVKTLALAREIPGLQPGRRVAVHGNRLRVEALKPVPVLILTQTGFIVKTLAQGDLRDLWFVPVPLTNGLGTLFGILDEGRLGVLVATDAQARARQDEATELAIIAAVSWNGAEITLKDPLLATYDPPSVRLNANVLEATHGETVKEVFEGGDATQVFQRFPLKQTPLTHVAASTPSGTKSTLRVWVDDVEWHEVPFLYGRAPIARVFITRMDGEGKAWIQFGDGVTGARLPTGQRNVRAEYRRGIGEAGNLEAGQINLLMSRPLGLKEAVNPLPSRDGKDPEFLEDARQNAPLTVLTLDRVVSLQDYEDFARAFAGVAKAAATACSSRWPAPAGALSRSRAGRPCARPSRRGAILTSPCGWRTMPRSPSAPACG